MDILNLFSLKGKVALVTGASRGLGRAISLGLAGAGADIIGVSRKSSSVEAVAREIQALGKKALALGCDVTQPEAVEGMVQEALRVFPSIDILVHSAGISPIYKRADATDIHEWDDIIATNLRGTFITVKAVGQAMLQQGSGRIILVASIAGQVSLPRLVAYNASKAGVILLTRTLATEWAQKGIRVNAIAPGFMETEMTEGIRGSQGLYQDILRRIPMGRFGRPDEVVGAALFLASEASSYVTGSVLFVDGGWTAW